jgi:polyisoprenoid-binding protein YceI
MNLTTRPSRFHACLSGLVAGAAAAIAASLVSLRLQSPDPLLLNSVTISISLLVAGVLAGLAYWFAARRARPLLDFSIWMLGAFLLAAIAALLVESLPGHPLLHVATYCIPLAGLGLLLIALLTPTVARVGLRPLMAAAPLAGIAGIVLGFLLIGRASAPTGRLALPDPLAVRSQSLGTPPGTVLHQADVQGLGFVVDPSQSKATYTVHEQLSSLPLPSDAVGTTSNVSGNIFLDGRPSTISVDISTFKSDQPARDRHLLFDPGLSKMGPAQFTTSQLDLPATYSPGDTVTGQVQGTMKLNNVEKPMTFTVDARLTDKTLSVHGTTDFTWSDFNITPPKFQEVLKIDNDIHAEVLLIAKAA